MAATPAPAQKNTVHWAPSPLSDASSVSTTSINSTSTLQYVNSQLVSHGFALLPGLSLDSLSSTEADGVTKCLLAMLSQRVEDMTRAEELTTKLRTLSYDHERLRSMHDSAKETAEAAERETAAARAKLSIAARAQQQAEAAHKQTTTDLQRARSSLQALRATHVAELKKRDKEIEAMRERWSKLSDSQLKIGTLPSGMTVVRPANARVLALEDSMLTAERGKGLVENALEEAESACTRLREENAELKGLVVDSANAVRRILHKAVTIDLDDHEFPPPLATNDLFLLGSPDAAFERLSKLLTALQDTLTALKTSATPMSSASHPKPQISLADLEKKVAESDAKAHKWEIEELQNTIAGLRDELKKARAEKTPAPTSRVRSTKSSAAHDDVASHLPPTDEVECAPALASQPDMAQDSPEPQQIATESHDENSMKAESLSAASAPSSAKHIPAPVPAPVPGPSRLSPRKTRSKSKGKLTNKSPFKTMRSSVSAKRLAPGSRPKRLASKRVEASFETEVKLSTVPVSLLPTSFVLPPPSPSSCLLPHPPSLLAPSVPLLFPSTTPPFPPPVPSFTEESRAPEATAPEDDSELTEPPEPRPFPLAKPLSRNFGHAYSPAKPSPLSRILMLADSPEGSSPPQASALGPVPAPVSLPALLPLALDPKPNPVFATTAVFEPPPQQALALPTATAHAPNSLHAPVPAPTTVFKPPHPSSTNAPAPAPLRTGTTSNTTRRRASKRTSGDAGLDLESDARPNPDPTADDEDTRNPRAPEKENTIRRRLRGPAATATKSKKTVPANASSSGTGPVRKVATAPRLVVATEPVIELGRAGGAASRLLAAASAAAGRGETATTNGPRPSS
ncbi:Afadin and alpha-actinin-binding-domain-containing protein [Lactarius akahatsu]|uniref:Afadin and alpha-actinin-binding-domain-containing protein n=1 Tax=Lactarius akahatsu TaxID=416441 RepID=A0AAD4LHB2_9AGAM|nr:Afadin and alpha-actinin-binding-domain-containing protein [Lactarius akahatsu]